MSYQREASASTYAEEQAALIPGRSAVPMRVELPPEPRSIEAARRAAEDRAHLVGADPDRVALAVSEAVTNVVMHAYRDGLPQLPFELRVETSADALLVTVTDQGVGMKPNLDSPGLGFGLGLIGRMSDSLEILEPSAGGVRIAMRFLSSAIGEAMDQERAKSIVISPISARA
jgi:serine/threonine-protein kinase RsbW